eukprot:TRINITY_DN10334_c0_g1_i1.p1 TRINITY_DN10334_c0_g1~~TRINITY_DN10334_c0_g1_i1.p1  ORF type:complete len:472 (-),score=83.36 TRINITY_DN10334_c0_g1_i1:584-1999(-)
MSDGEGKRKVGEDDEGEGGPQEEVVAVRRTSKRMRKAPEKLGISPPTSKSRAVSKAKKASVRSSSRCLDVEVSAQEAEVYKPNLLDSLPDVVFSILLDKLTLTDKKNLRIASPRQLNPRITALDPAFRTWAINFIRLRIESVFLLPEFILDSERAVSLAFPNTRKMLTLKPLRLFSRVSSLRIDCCFRAERNPSETTIDKCRKRVARMKNVKRLCLIQQTVLFVPVVMNGLAEKLQELKIDTIFLRPESLANVKFNHLKKLVISRCNGNWYMLLAAAADTLQHLELRNQYTMMDEARLDQGTLSANKEPRSPANIRQIAATIGSCDPATMKDKPILTFPNLVKLIIYSTNLHLNNLLSSCTENLATLHLINSTEKLFDMSRRDSAVLSDMMCRYNAPPPHIRLKSITISGGDTLSRHHHVMKLIYHSAQVMSLDRLVIEDTTLDCLWLNNWLNDIKYLTLDNVNIYNYSSM